MISNSLSFHKLLSRITLSKFLQTKLNGLLFRLLPFSISRWYIIILGRLYYLVHRQEKSLIQLTINYVFKNKMTTETINNIIKATFAGIFDHYHEKLFVGFSNFPRLLLFLKKRIRFSSTESLLEALDEGKGVILVTGHFGAVEFLPGALAVNGYPVSMICRVQTDRLLVTLRQRAEWVGLDLINADEGNIILNALKALKQGRILITECDEFDEWRPEPRRTCCLLNCNLPDDRTLGLLRKRSGAPIITAFVKRESGRTYTCNLTPGADRASPDDLPVSRKCMRNLEIVLEANPEQWYQWKKFGKLVKVPSEVGRAEQEIENFCRNQA
jgi:KDO2-lipid IV(A) lauroyltransferase